MGKNSPSAACMDEDLWHHCDTRPSVIPVHVPAMAAITSDRRENARPSCIMVREDL